MSLPAKVAGLVRPASSLGAPKLGHPFKAVSATSMRCECGRSAGEHR